MYSQPMNTTFFRCLATLAVAASGVSAAAHAQLPTDNPVWKSRCNLLAASAADISKGSTPAALVAATRGVSGQKFLLLAAESANSGNHNVACTLFYLSAIADRAGNGSKADASASDTAITLAGSERKEMAAQSISFSDRMAWTGLKFTLLRANGLSGAETASVLDAATTMPLTLNAPSPVQMADNSRNRGR